MKSSDILLSFKLKNLEVWKVDDEVHVRYANAEIKDGSVLVSASGIGADFESACDDYLAKIRGKRLVFDACTSARKEVVVLG